MDELVEIAACLHIQNGGSGDSIREAKWSDINSGKAFETRFKELTQSPGLKGEKWGEALANHLLKNPYHRPPLDLPEEQRYRPFYQVLEMVILLYPHNINYEHHKKTSTFDSDFNLKKREGVDMGIG